MENRDIRGGENAGKEAGRMVADLRQRTGTVATTETVIELG